MLGIDARAARITWSVAAVAGALVLLYLVRRTLFVFALALFLTYLLAPLARRFDLLWRHRVPRAVPVAAAFAVLIAVVAVVITLVGPRIANQAAQLADQLPAMLAHLRNGEALPLPDWLGQWREPITRMLQEAAHNVAGSALPVTQRVIASVTVVAGNVLYVVLVPVMTFIMLADGPALSRGIVRSLAPISREETLVPLFAEVNRALGRYVRVLGLLALTSVVIYAVALTALGVPYSIVLAAVAGVLEFIPIIGPILAATITFLVAAIEGYPHLLWLIAFFPAHRAFQDYILSPRLVGGGIGIHPLLVMFGFLAGNELAGIPGIFLSVPILATLTIVIRFQSAKRLAHRSTNARSTT